MFCAKIGVAGRGDERGAGMLGTLRGSPAPFAVAGDRSRGEGGMGTAPLTPPELELDAVTGDVVVLTGLIRRLGDPSSSELSGLATNRPGATPLLLAPCGRRGGVPKDDEPCVETESLGGTEGPGGPDMALRGGLRGRWTWTGEGAVG